MRTPRGIGTYFVRVQLYADDVLLDFADSTAGPLRVEVGAVEPGGGRWARLAGAELAYPLAGLGVES